MRTRRSPPAQQRAEGTAELLGVLEGAASGSHAPREASPRRVRSSASASRSRRRWRRPLATSVTTRRTRGLAREVDALGSRPRGLVDELDEVGVEQVGVLEHDDVARVVDDDVLGAGDALDDELTVRRRGEDVLAAVEDERQGMAELEQRRALVEAVEGVQVVVDDVERGAEEDVGGVAHDRPGHGRGEGVLLDEEVLDVAAHPAQAPEELGTRAQRTEDGRPEPVEGVSSDGCDATAVGEAETPRARRDESGTRHALEDERRVLLPQREHRHAAHRVSDEHEVAGRHELVDDRAEVLAEPLDRVGVALPAPRPPVPSLVPADDAVAGGLEGAPLVDPATQAEAVAVRQDHRRQLLGTPAAGRALGRGGGRRGIGQVDLAVQGDAVGREHDVLLVGHDVEQLRRLEGGHRRPVLAGPVGRDAGGDTSGHAERGRGDAEDGVATGSRAHASPSAPTWSRGTRGPSRVTIS